MYTDHDYHEMVLDRFIGSPYVREGMTDDEVTEKYHEVLAAVLDGYHWGDVLTDMKDFRFLFHELDIPGFREKNIHKFVGMFMGGTLFYTSDAGGDCLYFAVCDEDTEQQGKVVAARVSDPDENGKRALLLDVNTVLECPLESTEGTAKDDGWPWRGARDVCWYCGGRLVWQNDFSYEDVYGEGEGIVTFLHCSECGARVQYEQRDDEEEEDESSSL